MAGFLLPDADAFGVIALGAKGGGAPRADPFAAALMALFLFLEALFQLLHDLFPAAQSLDIGLFLFRQMQLGQFAQPFFWNFGDGAFLRLLQPLEDGAEDPVEFVQVALVLNQTGTGQIVEIIDAVFRHVG